MGFHHIELKTSKTSPQKLTLTVNEMRQTPDIGNNDSGEEISCLKWTIHKDSRKVCVNFKTDTDKLNFVVSWGWQEVDRIPVTPDKTNSSFGLHWLILKAVPRVGWNNYSSIKQHLSRMDVFLLMSNFRLCPGLKMSFQHRNLILSACCCCWDFRLS